ncbi:MAG TPA: phosphate ABC transporter ATP-binding protein [Candidatus Bathyarchaeia archaeon]
MDYEEPVLKVRNLNVNYGQLSALKNINVDIPRRGVTAILGPSGCGKTTLLKSFNRLVELNPEAKVSGEIILDGVNVNNPEYNVIELRKRVGMIGQVPTPLPMSIYNNVAFGPRMHGLEGKDTAVNVERCLRTAGLWEEVKDRLREPANRLSVGQQQRLSLARALAVEPEVLLCDEPTSALDPVSAKHVEDQLMGLKREYSILFVTHTLRQAKRISDYVLFMYMGELVEHGPAHRMFTQPTDTRTREYMEGVIG